jgi:hypothetical protein
MAETHGETVLSDDARRLHSRRMARASRAGQLLLRKSTSEWVVALKVSCLRVITMS